MPLPTRAVVNNDEMTLREFSAFLANFFKDLPASQKIKLRMDLRLVPNYVRPKNPINRLILAYRIYVRRGKTISRKSNPEAVR